MESIDKLERKKRKKEYKKAKRKLIYPWKALAIFFTLLSVVLTATLNVVKIFDNSFEIIAQGGFWELENKDANAIYFQSDYESEVERLQAGAELIEQVEAEGAVLLLNENNTLPLASGSKVSCFSSSSVNLVYGGTGSGNVDASSALTLKEALERSGFEVNKTLWNFYTEGEGNSYVRTSGNMFKGTNATLSEVPWDIYTDEVKESISSYGDAAIVVLSRVGGEGRDLEFESYNYLELNEDEKEMMAQIKSMKEAGIIEKVVVLVNTANALEMDFLLDDFYGVDTCLWIGDVGGTGINAISEILNGNVNPSGRLVATYCYDNFSSPAMMNFAPQIYEGADETLSDDSKFYVVYKEGIYVGYKYYETRYEDFVMGTGNAGTYDYSNTVAFPFGYGMSYTDFAYSNMSVQYNEVTDQFEVTIKVTNTGAVAGKETVQIYVSSPYTSYDKENGVEKAAVSLAGFEKTDIIEAGARETLTIYVDKSQLASYDAYGYGTYILEDGDYYLTVAKDAHNAVNNVLAAKGYTVESTDGRMDAEGNALLTFKWNNPTFDAVTYSVSANGTKIENQLSDVDPNLNDAVEDVSYLSRSDWENTLPTESVKFVLNDQLIAALAQQLYNPDDYETMTMPTLGADNGLTLYDMIGLDFDDPKWQDLLDQLTFDEMISLVGDSFHWTMPVESVNAPGTRDENGPQGLTGDLFGVDLNIQTTALTSEDVMAATYNRELMYEIGRIVGNDCLAGGFSTLYGPGNNIHRTPYSGRNFEYYSEDGFLSGEMTKYEVKGIEEKGVKVVMKHFALNDSENEREGLGIWANEQAIREIYLKAFQPAFEEVNANGVMTSYTRWGTTWSGAHKGLITNILREEWGCKGKVISDNVIVRYINGVDGILAGSSAFDAMLPFVIVNQLSPYEKDSIVVQALKDACHHNLYAVANSNGMNYIGEDTIVHAKKSTIVSTCTIATFITLLMTVGFYAMWILNVKKLRQTEEYVGYKDKKIKRRN